MIYTLMQDFGLFEVIEESENLERLTHRFMEMSFPDEGTPHIIVDENDNIILR